MAGLFVQFINLFVSFYSLIIIARVFLPLVGADPLNPIIRFIFDVTEPVLAPSGDTPWWACGSFACGGTCSLDRRSAGGGLSRAGIVALTWQRYHRSSLCRVASPCRAGDAALAQGRNRRRGWPSAPSQAHCTASRRRGQCCTVRVSGQSTGCSQECGDVGRRAELAAQGCARGGYHGGSGSGGVAWLVV